MGDEDKTPDPKQGLGANLFILKRMNVKPEELADIKTAEEAQTVIDFLLEERKNTKTNEKPAFFQGVDKSAEGEGESDRKENEADPAPRRFNKLQLFHPGYTPETDEMKMDRQNGTIIRQLLGPWDEEGVMR